MIRQLPALLVAAALLMTHADTAAAQSAAEPLRYTLSFPAPQTNYMEVSVAVPTERRPEVELMMAVWTPGSYLVREYERNVENVTAAGADGRALAVMKSDKNRWRVTTGGAANVTVKYRVYAREMSVRTNWVDAGFALVNGAPTFLTLADRTPRAHEVVITPATGWSRSMTSLPEMPGGPHRYRAPDFDTLADSPIVIGNPAVHEFTVDGKKHYLVNEGEGGVFDGARAAKDLEAIVREYRRMWGFLPYEKYLFLNLLTEAGGGLEHKNSTVLMTSRWTTRTRRSYVNWLDLASHEFFHAWNVKRLRPVELGPFDYENEVHTKNLWIAEGVTEYYGALTVHRAGLMTREEYLDSVSDNIEELQTTPGRQVQSAEMASYDAWIKYYRPDENSINTAVSYYTKGAVVGLLLDARIRKLTNGAKSLDDVMKAAYEKYSGMRGYTADEFRGVAEQVAGTSLKPFWDSAVSGTDELDYKEALDTLGLRFRSVAVPADRPGRAWLGIGTRNDAGRLLVSQVRRDTPAQAAGLNVDDEILAIDDYRVRADRLDNRLDQYRPGDKVVLLVARREQLLRLPLTFGTEPGRAWRLEVNPSATDAQQSSRGRWLNPGRA
jgi:predicted metalloprotease with PDZ domain